MQLAWTHLLPATFGGKAVMLEPIAGWIALRSAATSTMARIPADLYSVCMVICREGGRRVP
mgnify:CR=1 FL=1